MSNSLADQLLKAGLVSEDDISRSEKQKQARKSRPPKKKGGKPQHRHTQKNTSTGEVANAAARQAVKAGAQAHAKDAEKKAQQEAAEQRRLMNIKIGEILEGYDTQEPKGDEKFNYVYQNKVRGIYLSKEQRDKLTQGEYVITVFKAKTRLIPADAVEALKAVDPDRFIYQVDDETPSEDDPYSDHPIPDDLVW